MSFLCGCFGGDCSKEVKDETDGKKGSLDIKIIVSIAERYVNFFGVQLTLMLTLCFPLSKGLASLWDGCAVSIVDSCRNYFNYYNLLCCVYILLVRNYDTYMCTSYSYQVNL